MADLLAAAGIQRRANRDYEQEMAAKQDAAIRRQTQALQLENAGLQTAATRANLTKAAKQEEMQNAMREAFGTGGYRGVADVAKQYGDIDTYQKIDAYLSKAQQEGFTDLVKYLKVGNKRMAVERYNRNGDDRIDDARVENGNIIVTRNGVEEDEGPLEDHARVLGFGDKVEYKDGAEYRNGQPTGKFAPRDRNDPNNWKQEEGSDGAKKWVFVGDLGKQRSDPNAEPPDVRKDTLSQIEQQLKGRYPDVADDAEETKKNALARTNATATARQILRYNKVDGMTPEIAARIAGDLQDKTMTVDEKGNQVPVVWKSDFVNEQTGESYSGLEVRQEDGTIRKYRLHAKPVKKMPKADADKRALPTLPDNYRKALWERRDDPKALAEFDKRIGIPGAAKRYIEEMKKRGGYMTPSQADVRKAEQ